MIRIRIEINMRLDNINHTNLGARNIHRGYILILQDCFLPAILMTDCVLNLRGLKIYTSSLVLMSVIVDVLTMG